MESIPFITQNDVERYQQLRASGRELSAKMLKAIPKGAMTEMGKALGILRDGVLVFDSMDVTSVLMDACLFDWVENGKNVVQKYIESHPAVPGTDESLLLEAYGRVRYRIILPVAVAAGAGAWCHDILSSERLLLMDIGLSQSMADGAAGLIATRTAPLGPYWITTGAPLPIGDKKTGEAVLCKLNEAKLLEDKTPAGEHKLALAVIRECLDCGAADYVRYEGPEDEDEEPEFRGRPVTTTRAARLAVGRNDPCPCGSGKKYKRCCLGK